MRQLSTDNCFSSTNKQMQKKKKLVDQSQLLVCLNYSSVAWKAWAKSFADIYLS